MSIKPLDLQTLFVKMSQVGKEQAVIQKSVENQQSREATHQIKEENDREHSVNKAKEDRETDSINDENGNGTGPNSENERRKGDDGNHDDKVNYFSDPKRGHNIDISG